MLSLNHTVVHFTMGGLERVHVACFRLENWWKVPCQHPSVVWWNTSLGGWKDLLLAYNFKTNSRGLALFQRVWLAQASVSLLSPFYPSNQKILIAAENACQYFETIPALNHNLCIVLTQASFFLYMYFSIINR